jgi:peptidyl-prolyl cis-trans isomerase D
VLDYLRRNKSSLAVQIVLGLIAIVFIFFMGGGAGLVGSQTTIAQVGDYPISLTEYRDARNRNEQYYREQYGSRLTPELIQALDLGASTLNQLVDGAVLENEAIRIGLTVPDEAVRYEIREIDAFRPDGVFSVAAYNSSLQRQGLSPSRFETNVRQQMLIGQLVDIVRAGVHVSEDEAFDEYRASSDEVTLEYIKVSSTDLQDTITITDAGLAAYFDENRETYRISDGVKVGYLKYSESDFADADAVSDEDIEDYYSLNVDREFTTKEEVGARHILKKFKGDDEKQKAEARAAIDKVAERLKAGEDFAEVAKEESEDGSAASGGDLGRFGRGAMVKPFEEVAFDLAVGSTSDVVETQFGYHIIKVYSHEEGRVRPLDEVHDEIAQALANEDAKDRVFDSAADDALAIQDGVSIDTIAQELARGIEETGTIREGDIIAEITPSAPFVQAALDLTEVGDSSEAVRVGNDYYIIVLRERVPSHLPELDDVRDDVEAEYRKVLASDAARDKADTILAEIKGGKEISDYSAREDIEIDETDSFARPGGFIPGLGNLPAAKEAAFATKNDGDVLPRTYSLRGDAFVLVRKSYDAGTREEFEDVKDERLATVRRRKEQAAMEEFVRSLKESTPITYNQQLVEAYVQ